MDYKPREIEKKWRQYWVDEQVYRISNDSDRPKFYVLDMFPYPSGAGLHVGHPLGYIASDIFSRYKRLRGFNVLHPMGYDAFGLPAEQYAIQTGVHPAKSTAQNVTRYREQLDNLGLSFDWSREVLTSDPNYYKWTQWIFLQLFDHYYDQETKKGTPIADLEARFEQEGNAHVQAATSQTEAFSAEDWKGMSAKAQSDVLMNYRLAYRKETFVNWCEALGTVLANDEVKDGVSERGGFPVERRPMLQWSLRITAYAERLLNDLQELDWSEAMKKMQSNWIGRSEGAQLFFDIKGSDQKIEIFTTRPDTIFGATYMVLAPEHDLVEALTTPEQKEAVQKYIDYVTTRSERDRMSEVKVVTGAFIGAYAINPFTNEEIPIWIGEYVLKDYGSGAIMAVPSDDDRDHAFATKFGLPIIDVIDKSKYPGSTRHDKEGILINSGFLDGMEVPDAIQEMFKRIEEMKIGKRQINYKLRDAIYSRQRYWGEPFPVIYDQDGVAHAVQVDELAIELPELDDFKPASGGKSPLARVESWVDLADGFKRETDTMPGFAGSSWYFLRYMDANNPEEFASQEAINYWKDVDLYVGGTEHAVGHLMYSRFWHKFLYDKGLVPTNEPFQKLINQGMIQGTIPYLRLASFIKDTDWTDDALNPSNGKSNLDGVTVSDQVWISLDAANGEAYEHETLGSGRLVFDEAKPAERIIPLRFADAVTTQDKTEFRFYQKSLEEAQDMDHADAKYLKQTWELAKHAAWRTDEEGHPYLGLNFEIGKMSKSKYNAINPDDVVERYGADCFRMYEMFLGPVEQAKPWDTKGIDGVSKFLRKFWGLFFNDKGAFQVTEGEPNKEALKILHTAIKKVTEDIERFSFNTCVSGFMVATNDLKKINCTNKAILQDLVVLIAPFAVHLAEELWHRLGNEGSVHQAQYPEFDESHLKEDAVTYPIGINGKTRATVNFPVDASKEELEKAVLEVADIQKWIEGKTIRKVIVVPKRMINIVVG